MREDRFSFLYLLKVGRGALDHKELILQIGCVHNTTPSPLTSIRKQIEGCLLGGQVGTLTSNFKRGLGLYLPDKNNPNKKICKRRIGIC